MEKTFVGDASAKHLDSYTSAAGLMQLSCAVAATGDSESLHTNSTAISSRLETLLPPGWHQIMHHSGLPCYVHDALRVICWTRPYSLDVVAEGSVSQQELHGLVRQHVPPLDIFTPGSKAFARRDKNLTDATDLPTSMSSVCIQESSSKKRKLDATNAKNATNRDHKVSGKQPSMTLEDFKTLSIGDPRVLQACMELSIKTPAQVLQEYQNRNRGVSINYNVMSVEGDGVKLFKTIVTAGSSVAEGVASTKKIAKQLGAQQLLAMLHERTAKTYYEVAEMYNSSLKGQPVHVESSVYGPAFPLSTNSKSGHTGSGNVDPRLPRSGSVSSRMRRTRRLPSNQGHVPGYSEYESDRLGNALPYHNQQYVPQQAIPWTYGGQHGDSRTDNVGSERVVVYSQTAAGDARICRSGQIDMNSENAWNSCATANPLPQPWDPRNNYIQQQHNGVYGERQILPGSTHFSHGHN